MNVCVYVAQNVISWIECGNTCNTYGRIRIGKMARSRKLDFVCPYVSLVFFVRSYMRYRWRRYEYKTRLTCVLFNFPLKLEKYKLRSHLFQICCCCYTYMLCICEREMRSTHFFSLQSNKSIEDCEPRMLTELVVSHSPHSMANARCYATFHHRLGSTTGHTYYTYMQ